MADAPVSFRDPLYASLDSRVEQKLGLPTGLLAAVRTRGEMSNADQVSEAGARTVYQVIPATRDAVLKKYGIDAYLSPENAAEAAGLLLKEGLQRNGGDARAAVGEYHGGTDRSQWGPRTQAYVRRVTGSAPAAGGSRFARGLAAQQERQQGPNVTRIAEAYRDGRMSEQEAAEFEEDVNAGRILMPRGMSLRATAKPAPEEGVVPNGVIEAYVDGRMNAQERADFEADVQSGAVKLPAGITLTGESGSDRTLTEDLGRQVGLTARAGIQGVAGLAGLVADPIGGVINAGLDAAGVGGPRAQTARSLGVQAADALGLPAPENEAEQLAGRGAEAMAGGGGIVAGARRVAGAATGMTQDVARVLAADPGKQLAAAAGAGLAAEGAAQAGGGPVTQLAAGLAGGVAGYGAAAGAGRAVQAIRTPAAAIPEAPLPPPTEVAPSGAATYPVSPGGAPAAVTPMAADDLAQTAKTAASGGIGSTRAKDVLSSQAAPDTEVVAAARRLGVEDYLQPDHVTTNQAFRELSQAVKSVPGSQARAAELDGLAKVAQRADDIVSELGGTRDLAAVSAGVKSRLQAAHAELKAQASRLYDEVREAVPAKSEARADTVLGMINQRADELGGLKNLSSVERTIARKLAPAEDGTQPTYALLDDVRRDITAARFSRQGAFKDADDRLLIQLEKGLRADQEAAAATYGVSGTWNLAQATSRQYLALQDDLTALFGKALDGSIVGDMSRSVNALGKGDTSQFMQLLKSVPESMRPEVVASGLNTVFQKNARDGAINFHAYRNWYEGLRQNRPAYNALMANLPAPARQQLHDLALVSRGISQSSRERIVTGRIQAVRDELQGADTLMARLYGVAQRASAGLAAEAVTAPLGVPGAGVAAGIASALTKGKPNVMKAVDDLIASPEFLAAARNPSKTNVNRLAQSGRFTAFVRAAGNPQELSARERWILQALAASQEKKGF